METMQSKLDELKGFEEAKEIDVLTSKYFKPETNIKYALTFRAHPDGAVYKLFRKSIPKFNDPKESEVKTILSVCIDSVDGKKVENESGFLEWSTPSKPLREALEIYCTNGNLLKKVFSFVQKGESKDRKYQISEVSDKPTI